MELDIKELGITLIVGAFAILGLEAIFYYFFGKQFTGFQDKLGLKRAKPAKTSKSGEARDASAQNKEETQIHPMKTAVFIGIAFAIGIIAEDLSYKYVDSVQTPFKFLPASISSILPDELNKSLGLPSKEGSRVKTLIINLNEKPDIQPLAIELANHRAFSKVYGETGKRIEWWIINFERCSDFKTRIKDVGIKFIGILRWYDEVCESPSETEIISSIYRLYYYAKDSVYLKQTYFDEMRKIETRRDFSRSISLIAFVYLIGALILGLGRAAYLLIKYRTSHHKVDRRSEIYQKALPILMILFCIYFFSMWAYERESDEFNKRAFGYFSAMLIAEELESNKNNSGVITPAAPDITTHSTGVRDRNSFNPKLPRQPPNESLPDR